jgi:hypothetical protein
VRRYIHLLDKDYTKNKVTVSANLSNLFNSFMCRHYKPSSKDLCPAHLNNFFDFDKWQSEYDNSCDPETSQSPLKSQTTSALKASRLQRQSGYQPEQNPLPQNQCNLFTKSSSTHHIPSLQKSRCTKRIYGTFDTAVAHRMFGYRVQFNRANMEEGVMDPGRS